MDERLRALELEADPPDAPETSGEPTPETDNG
jgi:hypothetical protein